MIKGIIGAAPKRAAVFGTVDEHLMLWHMIQNGRFRQREMARDIGTSHGSKISRLVRHLEGLDFVAKTADSGGREWYEVTSRAALLDYYARHRSMADEKAGTFYIGRDVKSAAKYLKETGSILCLTSALGYYDDGTRDPELHAYAPDPATIDEAESGFGAKIRVNLYLYKYPDRSVAKNGMRITSKTRTAIDLYCSGMGYLARRLIPKI